MTVTKEYMEGKTRFRAADVDHYAGDHGQPTTSMPVFYNPRMRLNRDLSVLFLTAYLEKNPIDLLCEPLAGCGVRTLRYLNECSQRQGYFFDWALRLRKEYLDPFGEQDK